MDKPPAFKLFQAALSALFKSPFGKRFANAGVTYNTGNWLAIVAAACQVAAGSDGGVADAASSLAQAFAGNGPSLAASLGSLAFFYSGRRYSEAWAQGFPPQQDKNNLGHIWSAIGAALLCAGLVGLSRSNLAMSAALAGGVLHVGGKSGSLFDPRHDAIYKVLPLLSRLPAIASLLSDTSESMGQHAQWIDGARHSMLPLLLIGCNVIWGRADVMLMPACWVKRALGPAVQVKAASGA